MLFRHLLLTNKWNSAVLGGTRVRIIYNIILSNRSSVQADKAITVWSCTYVLLRSTISKEEKKLKKNTKTKVRFTSEMNTCYHSSLIIFQFWNFEFQFVKLFLRLSKKLSCFFKVGLDCICCHSFIDHCSWQDIWNEVIYFKDTSLGGTLGRDGRGRWNFLYFLVSKTRRRSRYCTLLWVFCSTSKSG